MRMNPCLLLLLLALASWSGQGSARTAEEVEKKKEPANTSIRAVPAIRPATTAKPVEPAKPAASAAVRSRADLRLQPGALSRNEAFRRELGASGGLRFEQLQAMRRDAETLAENLRSRPAGVVPQNRRDYRRQPADCNDTDPSVRPGQVEVCNFKDDNCDGDVDEGVAWTVWRDQDGDGFGDPDHPVFTCPVGEALANVSLNNRDCDDSDRARNPSQGTCP